MRKEWTVICALALSGCSSYSKQVVQLHFNPGSPSQSTVLRGHWLTHVTSTTNVVPVRGLSPTKIFELEPNPPLAAFIETRLALMVTDATGVKADCSVSDVGMEVGNNYTKGTVVTNLTLQCNFTGGRMAGSRSYVGRDVRTIKAKFSGVDYKEEFQPGLEGCLQQIAVGMHQDLAASTIGM